jgi:ElaB/YqjD/DUF883 family membrane-anchored ribosome-binding protein
MSQFDTPADNTRERSESAMANVRGKAREGAAAFAEVADSFGDALDDSLRLRPYATLAIAAGIGFLFGAAWRR